MEKNKIIEATFDPVFKALLSDEKCKEYLADLIHMCTKIPKKEIINNVVIKNSELMNNKALEKRKMSDLIVEVTRNIIILEMNREKYDGWMQKDITYQNKVSAEQFLKGEEYTDEKKIIEINFNNFHMFDNRPIIKFQMIDKERLLIENENYERYHVNLALIRKKYYNKEELSKEEKELLMLTINNISELNEIVGDDNTMKKASEKLIDLSEDTDMIGLYDREIVERKVRNSMIKTAERKATERGMKKGIKEGIKEGIKKGIEQGIEQGIQQGIEQGIEQGINQGSIQKEKEVVINMLNKDFNIKTISEITTLTIEEIEKIKEEMNN